MKIRRANERGHANHGWLDSFHTFSFADYHDPAQMGFRALRVINEDRVAPNKGFGAHSHRDMEIVSYVLEGGLDHKDDMGNGSTLRPGDVQRMSAGTGVTHSEFNGSKTEGVHFLQIWILPDRRGHTPSYEQKTFSVDDRKGKLRLVLSEKGDEGSVTLHQDVKLYAGVFEDGDKAAVDLPSGRYGWVHVARGSITIGGKTLAAGDAAAFEPPENAIAFESRGSSEVLLFDLA